jgi:hypothetical protein
MRQRRTSAEVAKLVQEFRASGLSHRAFAEKKGVPVSTVSGWMRASPSRKESGGSETRSLVPVVSRPPAARERMIRIDLPCGTRVEIPRDVPREALAEILAVVDPRC